MDTAGGVVHGHGVDRERPPDAAPVDHDQAVAADHVECFACKGTKDPEVFPQQRG